jgi:hypothetical protein
MVDQAEGEQKSSACYTHYESTQNEKELVTASGSNPSNMKIAAQTVFRWLANS